MTTQYEDITDTTGATGYPGPQPPGTQKVVSPKDTSNDGDGSARFGGGPYSGIAPVAQPDTSGTDGEGELRDPTFTGYTTNADLMYGVGTVRNDYKAPSSTVPVSIRDTTGTDITGVGYNQNDPGPMFWLYGDQDTWTIGAGAPGLADSVDDTLAEAGVELEPEGRLFRDTIRVFSDSGVTTDRTDNVIVNHEHPVRLTHDGTEDATFTLTALGESTFPGDEDVILNEGTPVELTQTGISSEFEDMVVTWDDGGNIVTLEIDDDYTLSDADTGLDRVVSITWVDGGALPAGTETVNVSYEYLVEDYELVEETDYELVQYGVRENSYTKIEFLEGGSSSDGDSVQVEYTTRAQTSWNRVPLVEGIDYRITYHDGTATVYPTEGSYWEDRGVTIEFLYGTFQYLYSRDIDTVPVAPENVQAIKVNNFVEVQWDRPDAPNNARTEGFIVEGSTGSRIVVAASERKLRVPYLEHDRENNNHVTGGPETDFGTSEDYLFRVIAVNSVGTSEPSDWTTEPTSPTSWDQNPPSGIPYENRINPIYRADGTIVPGTGIGASAPVL